MGVGAQTLGIDFVFVYFVEALRWRRFLGGFGAAGVGLTWPGFAIDVASARKGERTGCNGERGCAEGAETFHGCLLAVEVLEGRAGNMRGRFSCYRMSLSASLSDIHSVTECPWGPICLTGWDAWPVLGLLGECHVVVLAQLSISCGEAVRTLTCRFVLCLHVSAAIGIVCLQMKL